MSSNHVLLETIELTQTAASVTFDNLPTSGYTDLLIKVSARTDETTGGATWDSMLLRFNGSSTGYSDVAVAGNGTSAFSFKNPFPNYIFAGDITNSLVTGNTFSSGEIRIKNYRSSNFKSVYIDMAKENNSTVGQLDLISGLWSNTAAITSIVFSAGVGSFVANSTFSLYGIAAVGTTPTIAPLATGGNMVSTDGTYWYHTFLTSGYFVPQTNLTCHYLIVAGGGAGGGGNGGAGGGAGGLRSTVTATGGGGSLESPLSLTAQNYPVVIGAGGTSGPDTSGTRGSNSALSTITATGGGGGGSYGAGTSGGSGGGSSRGGVISAGTANQGYAGGGSANSGNYGTGGGGGAGAVGGTGTTSVNASGGNGVAVAISGTSVTYAGGGGGGLTDNANGGTTSGGTGGGGAGNTSSSRFGTNGTFGTGSGGGGGGWSSGGGVGIGGSGGSGIVIIRYPVAS
jgi:hypothetical protein